MHKITVTDTSKLFAAQNRARALADNLLLAGYRDDYRDLHLNGITGAAEKLHELAETLGFRLVPIEPVEINEQVRREEGNDDLPF